VGRPTWAAESKRQQNGQSSVLLNVKKNHLRAQKYLRAFTKLRKATISFVMSVRLHGTTRLSLNGFS
jgi:hypothetical protein